MSNFAEHIMAGLNTLRDIAGVSVQYVRGVHSVTLTAVPSERDIDVVNDYGIVERVHSRDFVLRAADLVFDGQAVEPKRGDQIHETGVGKTKVYEVMSPIGNLPDWQWSDSGQTSMRVHTRLVDEVEVAT